jgi:hypothetical protein
VGSQLFGNTIGVVAVLGGTLTGEYRMSAR